MISRIAVASLLAAGLAAPALAAELRGSAPRPVELAVPKGMKCNVTESDERVKALLADTQCAGLRTFIGNMSDPKVQALPIDAQSKILSDFCSNDPCASKFDQAVASWRSWCASPDATVADSATFPIPENKTVVVTSAPLWVTSLKYGCSKTPKLGYCAPYAVSVNMTIAALPVPRNTTTMKGALCPFLTSCCVAMNAQWRPRTDAELDNFERTCPGSRAAITATSCQ